MGGEGCRRRRAVVQSEGWRGDISTAVQRPGELCHCEYPCASDDQDNGIDARDRGRASSGRRRGVCAG